MASIYDKASLVLIPSGTKTSKVYSQVPTNGDGDFTFSRSTAATRVNADGNIEKETQNLLLQSNSFDTTWTTNNASVTSGQSGYDGSSDAWKLQSNGGNYCRVNQSTGINSVVTNSIYAKAGNVNFIGATATSGSGSDVVIFNLSTGVVSSTTGSNVIDANIEDIGSGWYRCSVPSAANSAGYALWYVSDSGSSGSSSGDYVFIQDAQQEYGLVARDYIETTTTAIYGGITDNVPRLDYTDSSCPALLLEPQRTNYLTYSEYQSGGGFALGANITWNGFVESPEGYNNASRFTSSTTSASYVQINNVTIPAGDFTFSMWVKGVSGSFVNRSMYIPSHTGSQATMNEAPVAGEDWKLVYGSGTNTSGSSYVRTITLPFYDQPSGAVWEMYGFQLEAGSYATSYIPTYGSAVTRNYDLAQMLSLNNTSPAWTLFFDVDIDTCPNYNRNFLELDTSVGSRRASFRWFNGPTTNKIAPYFDVDSVYPFSTGIAENDTDNGKIVLRHDGNGNFSYFNLRNAVAQKRDYSGTPFTGSIIDIFGAADATELESILFFPTALSDEECKTLVS